MLINALFVFPREVSAATNRKGALLFLWHFEVLPGSTGEGSLIASRKSSSLYQAELYCHVKVVSNYELKRSFKRHYRAFKIDQS